MRVIPITESSGHICHLNPDKIVCIDVHETHYEVTVLGGMIVNADLADPNITALVNGGTL